MEFAAILFTPGNLLLWMMLAGTVLLFTRRVSAGCILLLLAAGTSLAIAVLPLDAWLARPLEDSFPRRTLPDHIHGVLILSGGPERYRFYFAWCTAPDSAEGRLVAAADLVPHHPEARLIFSGGIAPAALRLKPSWRAVYWHKWGFHPSG